MSSGQKARKRNDLRTCWYNMVSRCHKPGHTSYERYGGRGISVCDEWKESFEVFKKWALANGYNDHVERYGKKNTQIERIDNSQNYYPDNCCFRTAKDQANNRTSNRIETYKGVTDTVANLCRTFGADYLRVNSRLQRGRTIEDAMSDDRLLSNNTKLITYNGETRTQAEWTALLGFKKNTISERLKQGWSIDKALTTPTRKRVMRKREVEQCQIQQHKDRDFQQQ